MKKLTVISLGGSLIFPEEIDAQFLKKFKELIVEQIAKGHNFILITGGGKIARKYQSALSQLGNTKPEDLDWMGIYTTHTNAHLIRLMFGNLAHPKIVDGRIKKFIYKEPVLVGGGVKPGSSTDRGSVAIAKTFGAHTVINLSNIDALYDKDPRKFKDAKKITNISWDGLLKIIGRKWKPGLNAPFDPIAALLAKKLKLKAIIANGKNLKNLRAILENKKFIGTTIA